MSIDTQKLLHMASRLSITNDDDVSAALKSAADHIDAQAAEIAHQKGLYDIVSRSICAALERAGADAVDDPGEAIDVLIANKDREIARLRDAQTWQPIETAPKDGNTLLLRGKGDHRTADGYWLQAAYNGRGAWVWPYVHSEPKYWQPLPPEPDAALSGEGNAST